MIRDINLCLSEFNSINFFAAHFAILPGCVSFSLSPEACWDSIGTNEYTKGKSNSNTNTIRPRLMCYGSHLNYSDTKVSLVFHWPKLAVTKWPHTHTQTPIEEVMKTRLFHLFLLTLAYMSNNYHPRGFCVSQFAPLVRLTAWVFLIPHRPYFPTNIIHNTSTMAGFFQISFLSKRIAINKIQ